MQGRADALFLEIPKEYQHHDIEHRMDFVMTCRLIACAYIHVAQFETKETTAGTHLIAKMAMRSHRTVARAIRGFHQVNILQTVKHADRHNRICAVRRVTDNLLKVINILTAWTDNAKRKAIQRAADVKKRLAQPLFESMIYHGARWQFNASIERYKRRTAKSYKAVGWAVKDYGEENYDWDKF